MKNKNLYFKFQAFGSSKDEFEKYIANGIITWGDPVHRVLEDGDLLISQAKTSTTTPLVTVLVEGGAHRLIALIVIFLFQVVYYISVKETDHFSYTCQSIRCAFHNNENKMYCPVEMYTGVMFHGSLKKKYLIFLMTTYCI